MASLFSDHPRKQWQAAIKRFLQVNKWNTHRSKSINSDDGATPTSCKSGAYIVLEEEDKHKVGPLASKKVSD